MKSRLFFVLVFALLVLVLSGCKSTSQSEPPPFEEELPFQPEKQEQIPRPAPQPPAPVGETVPFTPFIMQRLSIESNFNENRGKYQFLLSGEILLGREEIRTSSNVDERGTALLESAHVRENITIRDKTQGQVMSIGNAGGESTLTLCFEEDNNLQLAFSAISSNPDALFYLNYNPDTNITRGDEKGDLMYGGNRYKLKFSGNQRPHLLLMVSRNEKELLEARTVSGRRVNNSPPAPDPAPPTGVDEL